MKLFFSIITVKSLFKWIGRSTGLISGGKTLVRKLTFYVMYGILRNSTLRETNKYIFELFKKKFNTGRETHKFLIIVDNTTKARFKRQRGKKT